MINSVTVTTKADNAEATFYTDGSHGMGLVITNIDGLGPEEVSSNFVSSPRGNISYFNKIRKNERTITITGKLLNYNRDLLYECFPIGDEVILKFIEWDLAEIEDKVELYIEGYVESINCDYYGESEGFEVTVKCPDPVFKDRIILAGKGTISNEPSGDEDEGYGIESVYTDDDAETIAAPTYSTAQRTEMANWFRNYSTTIDCGDETSLGGLKVTITVDKDLTYNPGWNFSPLGKLTNDVTAESKGISSKNNISYDFDYDGFGLMKDSTTTYWAYNSKNNYWLKCDDDARGSQFHGNESFTVPKIKLTNTIPIEYATVTGTYIDEGEGKHAIGFWPCVYCTYNDTTSKWDTSNLQVAVDRDEFVAAMESVSWDLGKIRILFVRNPNWGTSIEDRMFITIWTKSAKAADGGTPLPHDTFAWNRDTWLRDDDGESGDGESVTTADYRLNAYMAHGTYELPFKFNIAEEEYGTLSFTETGMTTRVKACNPPEGKPGHVTGNGQSIINSIIDEDEYENNPIKEYAKHRIPLLGQVYLSVRGLANAYYEGSTDPNNPNGLVKGDVIEYDSLHETIRMQHNGFWKTLNPDLIIFRPDWDGEKPHEYYVDEDTKKEYYESFPNCKPFNVVRARPGSMLPYTWRMNKIVNQACKIDINDIEEVERCFVDQAMSLCSTTELNTQAATYYDRANSSYKHWDNSPINSPFLFLNGRDDLYTWDRLLSLTYTATGDYPIQGSTSIIADITTPEYIKTRQLNFPTYAGQDELSGLYSLSPYIKTGYNTDSSGHATRWLKIGNTNLWRMSYPYLNILYDGDYNKYNIVDPADSDYIDMSGTDIWLPYALLDKDLDKYDSTTRNRWLNGWQGAQWFPTCTLYEASSDTEYTNTHYIWDHCMNGSTDRYVCMLKSDMNLDKTDANEDNVTDNYIDLECDDLSFDLGSNSKIDVGVRIGYMYKNEQYGTTRSHRGAYGIGGTYTTETKYPTLYEIIPFSNLPYRAKGKLNLETGYVYEADRRIYPNAWSPLYLIWGTSDMDNVTISVEGVWGDNGNS